MADAEDLKSSGDFSSCGFDSHPGHQSFLLKMNELLGRSLRRGGRQISRLTLTPLRSVRMLVLSPLEVMVE
jgi:hypothetical protein